jgi:hypothetical protein
VSGVEAETQVSSADRVRWRRILGLGNAADAIEILSIGYILAVYEDKEGELSRSQQST